MSCLQVYDFMNFWHELEVMTCDHGGCMVGWSLKKKNRMVLNRKCNYLYSHKPDLIPRQLFSEKGKLEDLFIKFHRRTNLYRIFGVKEQHYVPTHYFEICIPKGR
jgi:hypothetical protein